jgi:hypothetical protein
MVTVINAVIREASVTYGAGGWTDERPGHHQTAPQRRKSDAEVWADIRVETVYRMQTVSSNHASVATNTRPGGRRIGPHALAFLYAFERNDQFNQPTDMYTVEPASRIFAWSDDDRPDYNVKDAPVLVRTMATIARQEHNAGNFDPLSLTDRADTPLPPGAAFVGVGLSSLGDISLDWGQLRASAFGLELPARAVVRLTDGSWIEMAHEGRGTWRVDSNTSVGYLSYFDVRTSIPPDWVPRPDSVHAWVDDLVTVCVRAYREAAVAAERAAMPRQRSRH